MSTEALAALIGALSAAAVSVSPVLYRWVTGRAKAIRDEREHLVAHLREEIERLTEQREKLVAQVVEINERLLLAERHVGECNVETAHLTKRLERLEADLARLRKRK